MEIVSTTIGASDFLWGTSPQRNLGMTKDGGKFVYEVDVLERFSHETGSTPNEICIVGRSVCVEALLLEDTIENLLLALGSEMSIQDPLDEANKAVEISVGDGEALVSDQLILRPIGAVDYEKDIVLWKACVLPQMSVVTHVQEDRVYRVTFKALVDEDAVGEKRLARFGDFQIAPSYH